IHLPLTIIILGQQLYNRQKNPFYDLKEFLGCKLVDEDFLLAVCGVFKIGATLTVLRGQFICTWGNCSSLIVDPVIGDILENAFGTGKKGTGGLRLLSATPAFKIEGDLVVLFYNFPFTPREVQSVHAVDDVNDLESKASHSTFQALC
ncbi:hypothetical protein C0J52_22905, partial [Blattella germanica]